MEYRSKIQQLQRISRQSKKPPWWHGKLASGQRQVPWWMKYSRPAPSSVFTDNYSGSFDGADEYLTGGDILGINNHAISVASWWKPVNITATNERLLCRRASGNVWFVGVNSAGAYAYKPMFSWGGGGTRWGATSVSDGTWYHHVWTNKANGTPSDVHVYLNGVNDDGIALGSGEMTNTSGAGYFQVCGDTSAGVYFEAILGDFSVWPIELSASEAAEIYNEPDLTKHSRWSDLQNATIGGWWTFDDPLDDMINGATIYDQRGGANDHDLTPTNTESGDKVADVPP